MKITRTHSASLSSVKKLKQSQGSGSTAFSNLLDAQETETANNTSTSNEIHAPNKLDSMLVLQEVSDEEVHKKQAIRTGRLTLDALETLRDALLTGHMPTQLLGNIQTLVDKERHNTNSPHLNQILDEIELRAAVEVAKIEMRTKKV